MNDEEALIWLAGQLTSIQCGKSVGISIETRDLNRRVLIDKIANHLGLRSGQSDRYEVFLYPTALAYAKLSTVREWIWHRRWVDIEKYYGDPKTILTKNECMKAVEQSRLEYHKDQCTVRKSKVIDEVQRKFPEINRETITEWFRLGIPKQRFWGKHL